jgi:hypothetical protein
MRIILFSDFGRLLGDLWFIFVKIEVEESCG